jgi:hypothetical protein
MTVILVIDALHPRRQADFWAALLGWTSGDAGVEAPGGWDFRLVFTQVDVPKTAKNRIHLELASRSFEHRAEVVRHALGLGAHHLDLGQGDVPWVVLADPEGNEFCVLDPHPRYDAGPVAAILVETDDPAAAGSSWSRETDRSIETRRNEVVALRSPRGQWLELLRTEHTEPVGERVRLGPVEPGRGRGRDATDRLRPRRARLGADHAAQRLRPPAARARSDPDPGQRDGDRRRAGRPRGAGVGQQGPPGRAGHADLRATAARLGRPASYLDRRTLRNADTERC